MKNNVITPDELRGLLDSYSSEQQFEEDAKAISEGAKSLTDAVAQLEKCLETVPSLVEKLHAATTLKVSQTSVEAIRQAGVEAGNAAASTFNSGVGKTIANAKKHVNHVVLPASAAYSLLFVLMALVCFAVIILFVNFKLWQNVIIWQTALILGGFMMFSISSVLYLCHKGWM